MRQLESLLHNAIVIQADSIVSSLDASPIRSKCILSSEIAINITRIFIANDLFKILLALIEFCVIKEKNIDLLKLYLI